MRSLIAALLTAGAALCGWAIAFSAADAPAIGTGVRRDVLRLADGTVHLGTARSFDGVTVEFQAEGEVLRVPRSEVVAILFAGEAPTAAAVSLTQPPTATPENEPAPDMDLTGVWDSPQWGPHRLVQKGRRVYGDYDHDRGQIDGYIQGDEIRFWWWELTPHGEPWANADEGQRGDGFFKISPDGRTLTGAWRYARDMAEGTRPGSVWTATKTGPVPDDYAYRPPIFAIPPKAVVW